MTDMRERAPLIASADATIIRGSGIVDCDERAVLHGVYTAHLVRPLRGREALYEPLFHRKAQLESVIELRGIRVPQEDGLGPLVRTFEEDEELAELAHKMRPLARTIWRDQAINTVCTAGKNLALDTFLAGSGYTVVGPYMGLISSTSYTATAAGDTQASHSGWLEAGNANAPTYTSPRKTAAWNAASAGVKAMSAALAFAITGTGTVKGCFMIYGTGALTTIDNAAGTLMSAGVFSGGDKVVANLDILNASYSLAF